MTYSLDFRESVVRFINEGGSQKDAREIFKISRNTMYRWCQCEDLRPKVHGPRQRKLDKAALAQHVKAHPHAKLIERAAHFGVHINAIWYQLRQMKLTKKQQAICRTMQYAKSKILSAFAPML